MPDLALPSHTALHLGAIHKRSSVPNLLYVENLLCFCMCAHAFGMGHTTLTGFDPLELICAEPDPVSGGTRLAKYPSLASQQNATTMPNHPVRGLLGMCRISTTPTEQHCTRSGKEQRSKRRMDNTT